MLKRTLIRGVANERRQVSTNPRRAAAAALACPARKGALAASPERCISRWHVVTSSVSSAVPAKGLRTMLVSTSVSCSEPSGLRRAAVPCWWLRHVRYFLCISLYREWQDGPGVSSGQQDCVVRSGTRPASVGAAVNETIHDSPKTCARPRNSERPPTGHRTPRETYDAFAVVQQPVL